MNGYRTPRGGERTEPVVWRPRAGDVDPLTVAPSPLVSGNEDDSARGMSCWEPGTNARCQHFAACMKDAIANRPMICKRKADVGVVAPLDPTANTLAALAVLQAAVQPMTQREIAVKMGLDVTVYTGDYAALNGGLRQLTRRELIKSAGKVRVDGLSRHVNLWVAVPEKAICKT